MDQAVNTASLTNDVTQRLARLGLAGKKGLIVGVANEHSIAWGCAELAKLQGAEVVVSCLNEKATRFVSPLTEPAGIPLKPCNVENPGELQALVDFAIEMKRHGLERVHAMVEAGRKRTRPIIMTSIAMSAGMLPSALGVGEGGSFRAPMAIAVIGGIIVSTVLSLVVVPSFFLIMDDLSRLLGWLFGRLVGKKEEEELAMSREELTRELKTSQSTIDALEERLAAIEKPESKRKTGSDTNKVLFGNTYLNGETIRLDGAVRRAPK